MSHLEGSLWLAFTTEAMGFTQVTEIAAVWGYSDVLKILREFQLALLKSLPDPTAW